MFLKTLFFSAFILVHSWYPSDCCAGHDCKPVPCEKIIPQYEGGWKYEDKYFTKDMKRPSEDGDCHICLPYGRAACIFFPRGGEV